MSTPDTPWVTATAAHPEVSPADMVRALYGDTFRHFRSGQVESARQALVW